MNEFDKSFKKDVSAVNKRRNFLKKSATGAVIVSLPAKSVWGACSVSGALSGNLSTNADRHTCTMPNLYGGRSPGNWKDYKNNMHSTFNALGDVKSSYGKNSTEYANAKTCFINAIDPVYQHQLTLPSEFSPLNMTVQSGLDSNGGGYNNIYFHLAAVYLNTYFGFYSTYGSGEAEAIQAITDVFSYWYVNKDVAGFSISDSELGYNDGSTDWDAASCS
ncbi:hypothetical protein [Aliiglaciecola lipolytica]|uniref:Uncharacterized protein n=1 Tax=Aliiglaciecola lipolytica E3 TaxID=1127673 RepID=K6Y3M6_9ALTE|nr:hypothetical protein [Aliiglaciecola lipolytica]GAC12852.1 hypothetical protein GLIP_0198 [Aliiglaciecola lipolytica E3]